MKIRITFLIIILFITGCWDQKELSNRSIWIGSGFDRNGRGDIVLSGQILLPGQGGGSKGKADSSGNGTNTFVVTGEGKNVSQAAADLQGSLSREVFPSHRRVVFLGEQFAKNGIAEILDEHSRNPSVRLRTDIFVVKDSTAYKMVQSNYPLEKIPAIGAYKELEHTTGMRQVTFMRLLRAASSDGISPVLPVITMIQKGNDDSNKQESFKIEGLAIFDKKKMNLKGFINQEEAILVNWITGILKSTTITTNIPETQGRVSIHLSRLEHRILPEKLRDKFVFHVKLTGKGIIRENQTRLDLRTGSNVRLIQKSLENKVEKEIKDIILKMQQTYQEDIFGFGEILHRKSPSNWRLMKSDWNKFFKEADFDVQVKMTVTQIGLTGPSLHLREEETIK